MTDERDDERDDECRMFQYPEDDSERADEGASLEVSPTVLWLIAAFAVGYLVGSDQQKRK